jgi:3-hydroxy-3-methylglutaryl CoA synthase
MSSTTTEIANRVFVEVISTLEILGISQEIENNDVKDAINGNVNSLISVLEIIKRKIKNPAVKVVERTKNSNKEDEQYKIVNVRS